MNRKINSQSFWGLSAIIDLNNCDRSIITSPEKIKEYIMTLCSVIDMKPYGPTMIDKFGADSLEGYSAMQFIETSSIVLHCDDKKGSRVFIDIFSCKSFDAMIAANFSFKFFGADSIKLKVIERK